MTLLLETACAKSVGEQGHGAFIKSGWDKEIDEGNGRQKTAEGDLLILQARRTL